MQYLAIGIYKGSKRIISADAIWKSLVKYVDSYGENPDMILTVKEYEQGKTRISRAIAQL